MKDWLDLTKYKNYPYWIYGHHLAFSSHRNGCDMSAGKVLTRWDDFENQKKKRIIMMDLRQIGLGRIEISI